MTTRIDMNAQEALWLDLDRPTAHMVVDALVWFDEPVDWSAVEAVVTARLIDRYPAARRRVAAESRWGGYAWEEDPAFDPAAHIVRTRLPDPGGDVALRDYLGEQRALALDRSRPLWQIHFIDGYGAGAALLLRVHHAVADGIRVSQVVMSLCDDSRGRPLIPAPPVGRPAVTTNVRGSAGVVVEAVRDVLGDLPGTASDLTGRVVEQALGVVAGAGSALRSAWTDGADLSLGLPGRLTDYFDAVRGNTASVGSLLTLRNDPTIWTGRAATAKRVAWSGALPMTEIRDVAMRTGTTVPGVVISCLAGALRRYTVEHGAPVRTVVWFVPVNVQPFGEAIPLELGSLFALLPLTLPCDMDDPLERLAATHGRMSEMGSGATATIAFGLVHLVPYVPGGAARVVFERGATRSVGLLANMPGPRTTAYLNGHRIAGVMGFAPVTGDQPMSVSIVSYSGSVRLGMASDAGLVPRPQKIVDRAVEEFCLLRDQLSVAES